MRLTADLMLEYLAELGNVYARPKHMPDADQMASVYTEVLCDVPAEAVRKAVREYLRSEAQFFPKPGQLRAMAHQFAPALRSPSGYARWVASGYRDPETRDLLPCPACGSVLEERDGRLNIWHDHERHRQAGVPYHGPRTGPVRDGRMLPAHRQESAA